MYKVQVHEFAEADIKKLDRAGQSKFVARALKKMRMIAGLEDPTEHNNVTILDVDAPGWFRYRDGNFRIIFRFTTNGVELVIMDVLEVTMIAQRNEKTYGRELKRRYQLIEGKKP